MDFGEYSEHLKCSEGLGILSYHHQWETEHLWDDLEHRLRVNSTLSNTSVCTLCLEKWSKCPIKILLNLGENLLRRVEAAAKGGPTSHETLWIRNQTTLKFMCKSRQASEYFWQFTVR